MRLSRRVALVLAVVAVHAAAYWGVVAAGELGYLSGEPTVFLLWGLSFIVVPLVTWPDLVEGRHWDVISWAGVTYAIAVPLLVLGTIWYLKRRDRKNALWIPPGLDSAATGKAEPHPSDGGPGK